MNQIVAISCCGLCMALHASLARDTEQTSKDQAAAIKRMGTLDHQRRLKPGDAVSIRIVQDKREALIQVVAVTSEVQCPYIGLVSVAGLTCRDLAFRCKAELEKNFFKTATVLVARKNEVPDELVHTITCVWPEFVVAHGSFAKPGNYDLPVNQDLTVGDLLQRAGGHISKSAVPEILIIRNTSKGKKRILVNAQAILSERHSKYDLFLRDGDVVIVK